MTSRVRQEELSPEPRAAGGSASPPPASGGPVRFPEELPISARVLDIARAIEANPVVIVAGETGSGKTTQLPKICLAMGRGLSARIGVTQPRRIAATSVAARVAKELGVELGKEVGYKIRFSDRTSSATYVKYMTDGIVLAEIQGDPRLLAYDTLIIDEAHERSLNIDFLLGYLKKLLPKRPDLRVIISSATLETDRFASYFGGAPVIEVSGRTYPVEVIHREPEGGEAEVADAVANTVEEITSIDPRGDILVFLPGEREIHDTMAELERHGLPHTTLLPLYGRLPQGDQQRVFQSLPGRRIVLATNVAETSLTIPGIVYVVDSGLARVNRYSPRTGVTQLQIEPISRASADQRKGRAGRVQSGVCFRLYPEQDYQARPAYTDPEILRVGLSGVILQMKALGLGDIEDFPFLDAPSKRAVDEGYRVLEELGAIDESGALTDIGRKLARLPLDPRLGRMVLGGEREGALAEVLIIAAALGVQDPRERPLAAQRQADEAHRKFRDEGSDFAGLLKLWSFYQDAQGRLTQNQLRKACRDHFVSYLRMREWVDVHRQISRITREMGFTPNAAPAKGEAIHRALLPGLLSRIGLWNQENRVYSGARQTRFQLHPSSGLAKKPPAWIMAAELVETSQLFARMAASVEPAWLEAAAGPLCKRSYSDPHWAAKPAAVMAREQVTLYGLPIARDRRVDYGPIDPKSARQIFILHALVRQEYTARAPFMDENRRLFEEVSRLRDKARRSEMLADEHALELFFDRRVPEGVYSGKTFEAWRKEAEAQDPRVLHLSLADVLLDEAAELSPERFPDELELYGARVPLSYRFDPGEDDDGITLSLPLVLLPQADPDELEWMIPGWHAEKIALLLESLPKAVRKALVPLREVARDIAADLRPFQGPMRPALARAVEERTGERVPPDVLRPEDLPPYLRFYFRVIGEDGRVIGQGRDLRDLKERLSGRAREAWARVGKAGLERDGLTSFSVEALPERVPVDVGGQKVLGYPALVDAETSVSLRVLASRAAAVEATRGGLRRLILLQMGGKMSQLEQPLRSAVAVSGLGAKVAPGEPGLARQIALRALDEAFQLGDPASFPRTRAAFQARLDDGRRSLQGMLARLAGLARDIGVELDRVQSMLRSMTGKPGASRPALDDVRTQLDFLLPVGLFQRASLDRLAHLPRYLRAMQVRLERLPNGPQKDQAKAVQVLPFWQDWLKHQDGLRQKGVPAEELESFRWMVEELRVSLFAPELKAAVPVSPQRLAEQWKRLLG
ncbi:ATP-dependent RNA helicase HrpA [Sorangium cellulosum]|uniref:ATP-dependent RNA helicase HrpA n=1 Tax=Sorangium cellulosum TaxID=56 RepID=UPI000CF4FCF3|nr:ATP-dependent RNA helicase HrpA [Sorangium cellulosum]